MNDATAALAPTHPSQPVDAPPTTASAPRRRRRRHRLAPQPTGAMVNPACLPVGLVQRMVREIPLCLAPPELAEPLIRGSLLSLSLDLAEKARIFSSAPLLSRFQVEELIKTFDDERVQFNQLAPQEYEIIAGLQARALWHAFLLVADRCGSSPILEQAWLRRTLRRAASAGLNSWLDRLPTDWWPQHVHARWAYRHLYAQDHPAWVD